MCPLKKQPVSRLRKDEHAAAFDNSGTHSSVAKWCSVKDEESKSCCFPLAFLTTAP